MTAYVDWEPHISGKKKHFLVEANIIDKTNFNG